MKKTTKLLKINTCRECPHYWFNRGRFECCKMERAFKNMDEIQNIPGWCPLEDIKGEVSMEMFDSVNVVMPCPFCGYTLNNFQSKDGACLLHTIDPTEVGSFYTCCDGCNMWVQFSREWSPPIKEHRERPYGRIEIEEWGFELIKDHPRNRKDVDND